MSRSDLVRVFVRSDEEIAREIHDEITARTLWLGDDALEVAVQNGEVSVSGELSDAIDREVLTRRIAEVPGVVSVEADLQLA